MDVFSKRPSAGIRNQVQRVQWGDKAGVGKTVEGIATAVGEAVLDEVISRTAGPTIGKLSRRIGGFSGKVAKRVAWHGVNKLKRYGKVYGASRGRSYKRFARSKYHKYRSKYNKPSSWYRLPMMIVTGKHV